MSFTSTSRGGIAVEGVNDCLIEGPEAKFITGCTGTFFDICHCRCLEWRGLSFDWERDTDPIDDVVRVQNVDSTACTLDLLFFQRDEVSETMDIKALTQCDPATLTFGAEGASEEVYFYLLLSGKIAIFAHVFFLFSAKSKDNQKG